MHQPHLIIKIHVVEEVLTIEEMASQPGEEVITEHVVVILRTLSGTMQVQVAGSIHNPGMSLHSTLPQRHSNKRHLLLPARFPRKIRQKKKIAKTCSGPPRSYRSKIKMRLRRKTKLKCRLRADHHLRVPRVNKTLRRGSVLPSKPHLKPLPRLRNQKSLRSSMLHPPVQVLWPVLSVRDYHLPALFLHSQLPTDDTNAKEILGLFRSE